MIGKGPGSLRALSSTRGRAAPPGIRQRRPIVDDRCPGAAASLRIGLSSGAIFRAFVVGFRRKRENPVAERDGTCSPGRRRRARVDAVAAKAIVWRSSVGTLEPRYAVALTLWLPRPGRPAHTWPSPTDLDKLVRATLDGLVLGGLLVDDRRDGAGACRRWAPPVAGEGVSAEITAPTPRRPRAAVRTACPATRGGRREAWPSGSPTSCRASRRATALSTCRRCRAAGGWVGSTVAT
jgi:hypothetical protein